MRSIVANYIDMELHSFAIFVLRFENHDYEIDGGANGGAIYVYSATLILIECIFRDCGAGLNVRRLRVAMWGGSVGLSSRVAGEKRPPCAWMDVVDEGRARLHR